MFAIYAWCVRCGAPKSDQETGVIRVVMRWWLNTLMSLLASIVGCVIALLLTPLNAVLRSRIMPQLWLCCTQLTPALFERI